MVVSTYYYNNNTYLITYILSLMLLLVSYYLCIKLIMLVISIQTTCTRFARSNYGTYKSHEKGLHKVNVLLKKREWGTKGRPTSRNEGLEWRK